MVGPKGTELTNVQEKGEDMTLEVEFYGVEAWLGLLRGDPRILESSGGRRALHNFHRSFSLRGITALYI